MNDNDLSRRIAATVLVALAQSAQRGERCLWVTELAGLTGASLHDTLQVVELLYRSGMARPYFSDREARRAAACITETGLSEAARSAAATAANRREVPRQRPAAH